MKNKILATVVQKYRFRDVRKDFRDIVKAVEKDKQSGIIVFPEVCLSNFKDKDEYRVVVKKLKELSRESNTVICVGIEEHCKNRVYDSAFLIEGNKVYKYRKVHLVWDEPKRYSYGNLKFPVYNTRLGKIGMLICYDNEFPESMRCLKLMGAEIVCMPSGWPNKIAKWWDMLTRVRARENQVFLLAANAIDNRCGRSRIVDPLGNVIAEVRRKIKPFSCASAVLRSEKLQEARLFMGKNADWISNRRPGFYSVICRS